ncbi:DNA-directed RNA polymerase subunit P [Candidatus Woesearchaeota archaeon]|nr:DNA-directed RNA polymerase subunit P [Candidatus Woesearchaeota archaeon]
MAIYECLGCKRSIESENVKRRVRCQYCGSKLLLKPRIIATNIEAI